jgi:16S rRNA (guanine527-N7)-methyltransferase
MTDEALAGRIDAACRREGIAIKAGQAHQLAVYLRLLQRWNRVHNLTGLRGEHALVERGLIDSLRAAPLLPQETEALDVGSGAGLPAIPLAVTDPGRRWVLVEPRRKKVTFLEEVRRQLALEDRVEVQRARLEQVERVVPLITSRAVGEIAPEVARHLRPGGIWIVASTRRWIEDVQAFGGLEGLILEDQLEGPQGCWSRLLRPTVDLAPDPQKGG